MKKIMSVMALFLVLFAFSPLASADDTRSVAMTKKWTIKFNAPVDKSTITGDTVYIFNEKTPTKRVAVKYNYANGDKHVIVSPNGTYSAGNSYQLVVTNGVKSAEGMPLRAARTVKFTVENGCDVVKSAQANSNFIVQMNNNGDAVHIGKCLTTTAEKFNYTYANAVDKSYFHYEGESEGYYFINMNGQTMLVDKSVATKLPAETVSYYELKNDKFYHYVLNKNGSFSAIDSLAWPSFIQPGTKYYSKDGATFTDESGKVVGTAYNYFQHISIRSKSTYTAAELNRYMKANFPANSVMHGMGAALIEAQNKFNLNALFMLSLAAHESAMGTNKYALQLNNIYSLGISDINPDLTKYASVQENLMKVSEHFVKKYLSATGSYANGATLGNKAHGLNVKYATDPFWSEGIAKWMNRIDSYLGNKDKFAYELAVVNSSELNFLNIRNAAGTVAYQYVPANGRGVTIVGEKGTTYEIIGDYGVTPGTMFGAKQYIHKVEAY